MTKIDILGVKITNFTKKQALEYAKEFLTDYRQHTIFTPNPEMIVSAQKDKEFKNVLNQACLALADGWGLVLASRILTPPNPPLYKGGDKKEPLYKGRDEGVAERITGVDFMIDLIELAENRGASVYFLGGDSGIAGETALKIKEKFPNLKVVGACDGGVINQNGEGESDEETLNLINEAKPDILFVAFGHGKQEKWIARNLEIMPTVKIAMGVGGAFNFLAGKSRRAPYILRRLNLEWLWRLILKPRRIRRILNAVIVFPFLVLKFRFKTKVV